LEVLPDAVAVAQAAAEVFVAVAARANKEGSPFRVALAGGTTPKMLYALLASPSYRSRVSWDDVSFFFGDERSVPPDHPDSNYRMAHDALFGPLGIKDERMHRMKPEAADLNTAAAAYEAVLRTVFEGNPPRFDLLLLGMGPDGHTASLFPGNAALRERTRWVVPVFDAPKLPPERLTLTIPVLNDARQVLFVVTGPDKAQALRQVLQGDGEPDQYPAKFIRPGADRLLWLVDEAAGSALDRGGDA
jgi:6-phosphogluconolactonase